MIKILLLITFSFFIFTSCCSWCNKNCVKIEPVDVVKKVYEYPPIFAGKSKRPTLNTLTEEEGYCSLNNVEKEVKNSLEMYIYIRELEEKVKYYENKIKIIQLEEEDSMKKYEIEKKKLEKLDIISKEDFPNNK